MAGGEVWSVVKCVGVHLTSAGVPSGRVELFRSSLHCESEGDGQTDRQTDELCRPTQYRTQLSHPPTLRASASSLQGMLTRESGEDLVLPLQEVVH